MRRILYAIPLLVAVPLLAQQMPAEKPEMAEPEMPGTEDPTRVTKGTYKTDSAHSQVGFEVSHLGFNPYFGLFGDVTGTLMLDPANLAASKVDVMIPINSVVTSSKGLSEHLMRPGKAGEKPDFFGPNMGSARFVSTSVTPTPGPDNKATIEGNLTLNGMTKPVTLEAEFTGAGKNPRGGKETVGFEAEGSIKRSEYGIMGALPFIDDEVEIEVTVAFEKQ